MQNFFEIIYKIAFVCLFYWSLNVLYAEIFLLFKKFLPIFKLYFEKKKT